MGTVATSIKKSSQGAFAPGGISKLVDVTLSSSYATGGDSYTAALLGLPGVADAIILCSNANGYNIQVDHANQKFKVYQGDNANVAAAPGIEVPNATNLSAVTFRVLAHYIPHV